METLQTYRQGQFSGLLLAHHICLFLIRSVFNLGNDIFFGSSHEHECPKLLTICKPQDTAAEMH